MKRFSFLMFFLLLNIALFAQVRNTVTEDYILSFRQTAIENEQDYGIPSSITLAQGIIESASGRSSLAKEGNNHFGIKCHSYWQGKRMYKDDDQKNDCFRVYDSPKESYTDHSLFLSKGKRYQSLFAIDKNDYKAWAKGLKDAGYATNPQYADLLIGVIEVYDLDKIKNDDYYLLKENRLSNNGELLIVENSNKEIDVGNPSDNQKQPKTKKKKSLIEMLFGDTKWYQRRNETAQEKKRREMDEKIQKMIDEKDVQRTDFEVEFE